MTTYHEACLDPNLFGPWFDGPTWDTWRVLDKAMFGLPLGKMERLTFIGLTGGRNAPTKPVSEAWLVCGRRSGKDVKAASIAAYLATIGAELYGYRSRLQRGERGVVQLLAVDKAQAGVCLGYLKAMFEQPILKRLVDKVTADGIELDNGLAIEVTTNDLRRVRGRTVIAAVFDEVAFWRSDSTVNPDDEVYRAVKPAMITIPGAMLIGISSPYARKGLLWTKFRKHYSKDGDVLVVKAPTWVMNPTIKRDGEYLTEAFEDDPAGAAAEYGAEFRTDIESFVQREAVEACVSPGTHERMPVSRISYRAFVDPSGGAADSFTLAIGHRDDDGSSVLDVIRDRKPPFSPEGVVEEFAALLKTYRITRIKGDRYAGEWPVEQFRKYGITYEQSAKPKSDIYRDLLPLLNSGRADLLENDKMIAQLIGLERRTARGGRDSIDHAPGAHDDLINAAAGVLVDITNNHRPCLYTARSLG